MEVGKHDLMVRIASVIAEHAGMDKKWMYIIFKAEDNSAELSIDGIEPCVVVNFDRI